MPFTKLKNRALIALISGFTVLIISMIWLWLFRQHEIAYKANISATIQRNSNLVVALEQYTIRTLRNADAVLQLVKTTYEKEGPVIDIPQKLKEQSLDSDFFQGVAIIDEKGKMLISTISVPFDSTINFSQKSSFLYHSHQTNGGLYISKPVISHYPERAMIILSRRLVKPNGRFGGIVALQIEPATFTRFYADAELRPHDIISLIAPDGITYSRRTGSIDSYGENIRKSPLFRHVAKQPVGEYFSNDAIRGIPTYFSFRKLSQFPIIATVGTSRADALAQYRVSIRRDYIFATLISVLILSFSFFISIALLQRKRILKKMEESEVKYRSIVENSKDVIMLIRPDGLIKAVNPAAGKAFLMTETAMLQTSLLNLIVFDDDDDELQYAIKEGLIAPTFERELAFVRTDGSVFTGEIVTALHTDSSGENSVIIIIRDITERKRMAEQLLKEQREFQQKLTRQVILAQEQEREEIGRELHDNVNQVLTTVKLYLEMAASNQEQRDMLVAKSIPLVMESIKEIRSLSHSLSAPTLGTNSIIDSITTLIEAIEFSSQLQIRFCHETFSHDLSKEQKLAIYRIVQEQLNNIIKHAQASTVWITLAQHDQHALLTVKDNGKGFNTKTIRTGIGLNNIISRAKALEGNVQIISWPGEGCSLKVSLPAVKVFAGDHPTPSYSFPEHNEVY